MAYDTIVLNRKEAYAILFWAQYGIGKARGGSYPEVVRLVADIARENRIQIRRPKWGQYLKKEESDE